MVHTDTEPETINTWELMKDLEEDTYNGVDASNPVNNPQFSTLQLDVLRPDVTSKTSPLALQRLGLDDDNKDLCTQASQDSYTNASVVVEERGKPGYLMSTCTQEYADACTTSKGDVSNDKKSMFRPPLPADGFSQSSSVLSRYRSSVSSRASSTCESCVGDIAGTEWSQNNLQRALFFKYILADSNTGSSASPYARSIAADSVVACAEHKNLMPESGGIDSPQSSTVTSMVQLHNFQVSPFKCASSTFGPILTASNHPLELERFDKLPVETCSLLSNPEDVEMLENAMEKCCEDEQNAVNIRRQGPRNLSQSNILDGGLKIKGGIFNLPTTIVKKDVKDLFAFTDKPKSIPPPSKQYCAFETKDSRRTSINRRHSMDTRGASEAQTEESPAIVFYSTNSETDLKVFEACNTVRVILKSNVGSFFDERDIFQYPEYDQELRNVLNLRTSVVPTLIIKGKLVVGIDSVLHLQKNRVLESLLGEAILSAGAGMKANMVCVCRGGKFLICPHCKGRGKVARHSDGGLSCRQCSGTGLIKCPNCLYS